MMFQIATTYSLSLDSGEESAFSLSDGNYSAPVRARMGKYGNAHCYQDNIFSRLKMIDNCPTPTYREVSFNYSKIPYQPNMCLFGYFQSEKYFKHRERETKDLFSPTTDTENYIRSRYGTISEETATSIHVRRGDYLQLSHIHPPCSANYFDRALESVPPTSRVLVFSDDIGWCKNSLPIPNAEYIEGERDYVDLFLMSKCQNNIIANSSFSWWGAWLNDHPEKQVIAPRKWFGEGSPYDSRDLIPEGWITL